MPEFGFKSSGLLKPSSVGGFGLSATGSAGMQPFMPTARTIAQQRLEIGQQKPWWVEALEVPDELFFGQSLKAFAKGIGEGDVGEAFWEAFRKNPLFQFVDMLLPGQPITGDDVRFTDVRKAFGGKNVEHGIANAIVNTVGEIVMDPSSFLSFGAKIPAKGLTSATKGAAERGALNKWLANAERGRLPGRVVEGVDTNAASLSRVLEGGGANKGLLPFGAAEKSVPFLEAQQMGMRAAVVWRLPWTERGLIVPMPKALDIGVPRLLKTWAEFLNNNPVTGPVMRAVSRGGNKLRDGTTRVFVGQTVNAIDQGAAHYEAQLLKKVNSMVNTPAFDKAKEFDDYSRLLSVVGELPELDDKASIVRQITDGLPYSKAKARLKRELEKPYHQSSVRRRWEEAVDPDNAASLDSILELHDRGFPLPKDMLERAGLEPRLGIDIPGQPSMEFVQKDIAIADTLEDAAGEGVRKRAKIAESAGNRPMELYREAQTAELKLLDTVIEKHGEEAINEIIDAARVGREMAETMGDVERTADLLKATIFPYVPRNISPEVSGVIHSHFMAQVSGLGTGATNFVGDYLARMGHNKARKITDLTIFEANMLFHELGTKYTKGVPVGDVVDIAQRTQETLFGDGFIAGLKKMAGKGDSSAGVAAEFFNTNYFGNWMRRLHAGAEAMSAKSGMEHLLSTNSPIVSSEATMRSHHQASLAGTLPSNENGPMVAAMVDSGPGSFRFLPEEHGKTAAIALGDENAARFSIARMDITEDSMEAIRTEKRGASEQIADIDSALEWNLDDARFDAGKLRAADIDTRGIAQLKEVMRQRKELADMWREGALRAEELSMLKARENGLKAFEKDIRRNLEGLREELRGIAKGGADFVHKMRGSGKDFARADVLVSAIKDRRGVLEANAEKQAALAAEKASAKAVPGKIRSLQRQLAQKEKELRIELRGLEEDLSAIRRGAREDKSLLKSEARDRRAAVRTKRDDEIAFQKALASERRSGLTRIREEGKGRAAEQQVDRIVAAEHAKNGVLAIDELAERDPKAYERLMKKHPDSRVVYIDRDIYSKVWGKGGFLESLHRPDSWGSNGFFRWMDANTDWWRAWTLLPPAFVQTRARDYMSNMVLLTQSGVSPRALSQGMAESHRLNRLFARFVKGEATDDDMIRHVIKWSDSAGREMSVTAKEMWETLQGNGLLGSSYARDEMMLAGMETARGVSKDAPQAYRKELTKGILPPLPFTETGRAKFVARHGRAADNPINKSGLRLAEYGDDLSKLQGVLAHMKNGSTLDEALDTVRAFTYDPRKGLSSVERQYVRRMIPFYSWMKFAVRTQVGAYFSKPGSITFWNKLHDSAQKMAGLSDEEREAAIPEWVKDNLGIPYKRGDDGEVSFAMFGGYFPVGDIIRIANSIENIADKNTEDTPLHFIMENANPYLKVAAESVFNYSFYTQRDVEIYPGQPSTFMGIDMSRRMANALKAIRMLNEFDRLWPLSAKQAQALADAQGRGGAPVKSLADKLFESAANPLPRTRSVDVSRELSYKLSKGDQKISMLKGQLRKALEHPERKGAESAPDILKEQLAEAMARKETMEALRQQNSGLLRRR